MLGTFLALFDCTCDAVSGHARALTYTTAHGDFHTPMFMPVGTSATVKGVTTDQLRELGSQVVRRATPTTWPCAPARSWWPRPGASTAS